MDPDLTVPPTYWRALALTGQNRIAADLRTGNSKHSAVSLYCRRPTPESGQVPGLCTGSESGSAVYCATSAYGPPDKRRKPGLCTGGGEHSAASLRCFSQCLAGKPDYVQPVPSSKNLSAVLCADSANGPSQNQIVPGLCPRQRVAQYSFTVPLFPGAWPVFSLPGIAIHQQSVIYGIFYTELRFSRAGCWSIWA